MKILINATTAYMGGAKSYLNQLLRQLSRDSAGNIYTVYLSKGYLLTGSRLSQLKISCRWLGRWGYNVLGLFFWQQFILPRLLKKEKVDLLFSTANVATISCPCSQLLLVRDARFFSSDFKYWINLFPKQYFGFWLRKLLLVISMKRATKILVPSQAIKNDIIRKSKISRDKILVNHYGIDLLKFQPNSQWLNSREPLNLFYCTLYTAHKNFYTLFKSLILLKKRDFNNFKLTAPIDWSISGYRQHKTYKKDFALAQHRLIKNNLSFLGTVAYEKIQHLYRTTDIFLWPSLVESFGQPLIEAMASGIAIIAADTPINREICDQAALYFQPTNAADLADKIINLSDDNSLRIKLGQRAKERVKKFTWRQHWLELNEIFINTQEFYAKYS